MSALLIVAFLVAVALPLFVLIGFFHLILRVRDLPARSVPAPSSPPSDAPRVLVQLPVFDEPEVVEGLLTAAAALDWPRDRLSIQLLDDGGEASAAIGAAAVARLAATGVDVVHVRRGTREGFKPGALAYGMTLNDAPYVAILDADFRAPPDWLAALVARLEADPGAAFAQSRNAFDPGGTAIGRVQALAQDGHYVIEQGVRAARGLPIQFNGTGGVWRRSAIEAIGGWRSGIIAEDLDLALKAQLAGFRGLYLEDPAPVGQVPAQESAFRTQQNRWSRAILEAARTLVPAVVRAPWSFEAKAMTLHLFAMHVALPAFGLAVVLAVVLALAGTGWPLALVGLMVATVPALAVGFTLPAARRLGRSQAYWPTVARLPLVYAGLAIGNIRAARSTLRGSDTVFIRTPKSGK